MYSYPDIRGPAWWAILDGFPHEIRECETLSRLIYHAIRLKVDDVRLYGVQEGLDFAHYVTGLT